jgi:hypothetical protein
MFRRPPPYYDPSYRGQERRERSQAADSSKAPLARKYEVKPGTTILVLGDSMADWLAYGLEEAFADDSEVGVVRKIKTVSGLIRSEQRNEDWLQTTRDNLAAETPSYIVVTLGLGDRQPIRERVSARDPAPSAAPEPGQSQTGQGEANEPAQEAKPDTSRKPAAGATEGKTKSVTYEFRSDQWAEEYIKRIDAALSVVKSKGVPVLWVGLPAIRGTRSRSEVSYLNDLFRNRVEKAGSIYVDVWDGFIDEDGAFMTHGPDYDGQTRRLRSGDGVHFTKAGAVKLARYVEREIKRLMLARSTPMAMPEPQAPARPGEPAARAVIGPVVPLNGTSPTGAEELAGGGPVPRSLADPVASRLLVRGEPVPPQAGRADDFSWPKPDRADADEVTPFAPPVSAAAAPARRRTVPSTGTPQKRAGSASSSPPQVRQVR